MNLTEEDVKRIIKEELTSLLKSDRYVFEKMIQMLDGRNIQTGLTNGTKIGTAAAQKIALWGVTPVIQPSTQGTTAGFTGGGGSAVNSGSTFDGGLGGTAYTIGDVVRALKQMGILA